MQGHQETSRRLFLNRLAAATLAVTGVSVLAACGGSATATATSTAASSAAAATSAPATTASAAAATSAATTSAPAASTTAPATSTASAATSSSAASSAQIGVPSSIKGMTEFNAIYPVQNIGIKPTDQVKVGFVFVGPINDYGYNQAANDGRLMLEKLLPNVKTVYAENVPETSACERAMEQMVAQGCKIIFPTSYGYLDFAMNVGNRHKDVVLLHQGGLKNALNVGTYFGTIWQMVYSAGVAAGKLTKSNKLGFVSAHPIPQVLLNINAFHLGAASVNPNVTTQVVFTGDWCVPDKQTEATDSLVSAGVDVVTQHQDCSGPVVQAAERHGIMSVGYHADASPLAPKGWITGSIWTWGNLYAGMVQQIIAGTWRSSILRGGIDAGIVNLAPYGAVVPADVKTLVDTTKAGIISGTVTPFKGPIMDQSGKTRIAGPQPDDQTLESTDYLVKGVTGTLSG